MANEFTYKKSPYGYTNGGDLQDLTVVLFYAPSSTEVLACAYSCYMNIDFDGDPQAYGPLDTPGIRPSDNLFSAGWKAPVGFEHKGKHVKGNDDLKNDYDQHFAAAKAIYEDLLKQRDDLEPRKVEERKKDLDRKIADASSARNAISQQPSAPADKDALDKKIAAADKTLSDLQQQRAALEPAEVQKAKEELDKQKIPPAKETVYGLNKYAFKGLKTLKKSELKYLWQDSDTDPKKPKNLGKIFWDWFGLQNMTIDDVGRTPGFNDPETNTAKHPMIYHPNFMQHPGPIHYEKYEDVYGAFPVVQVAPEPGPGYFVSQISPIPIRGHSRVNMQFPEWDQRSTLLPHETQIQPYAAISGLIKGQAQLNLGDQVFAIRLDSGQSLTFPFVDSGNWEAIGECSSTAYLKLGGTFARGTNGLYKSNDPEPKFLYLAFPKGRSPSSVLTQISGYDNADEFLPILSFICAVGNDVTNGSVSRDPVAEYKQWKTRQTSRTFNGMFADYTDVIESPLRNNGYQP